MIFEQFREEVRYGVAKVLGNGFKVKINEVTKNNAVILTGITIEEKGNNVHPTMYINDFYEELKQGKSISAIVFQLIALYQKGKMKKSVDMEFFKEFEKVKSNIVFKLINYEKNKEFLKSIPHILVLDLAIVFYYRVDNEVFQNANIQISRQHSEMWKVNNEDLLEVAKVNTSRLLPKEIKNMEEVIRESLLDNIKDEFKSAVNRTLEDEVNVHFTESYLEDVVEQMLDFVKKDNESAQMYVLTNKMKINGAACIFYKGVLKEFAQDMKKDIYILPSSIHEVILIPTQEKVEAHQLSQMVREVNATELETEEILSNNVYYYSRISGEIMLCDK